MLHIMLLFVWLIMLHSATTSDLSAKFPQFSGDRVVLQEIIKLSGSIAERFPRDAKCLDDVLGEDYLLYLIDALPLSAIKPLGKLLTTLSTPRFDALCLKIRYGPTIDELVSGYEGESRWKPIEWKEPLTCEVASRSRVASDAVCKVLEACPGQILWPEMRLYCIQSWLKAGKANLVRRMAWEIPPFTTFPVEGLEAFRECPEGFVMWFKHAMDNTLYGVSAKSFKLPDFLKPHHLQEIQEMLSLEHEGVESLASQLADLSLDPITPPSSTHCGFDPFPFEGKWALARPLSACQKSERVAIYNLDKGYPMEIEAALEVALKYGNMEILENSLIAIKYFDPDWDGEEVSFWLQNFIYPSGMKKRMYHLRHIFAILNKHEIVIDPEILDDAADRWHLLPLFQDMIDNPGHYWSGDPPAEFTEKIKQIVEQIPQNEEKAVATMGAVRNYSPKFLAFSIDQGWVEMARKVLSLNQDGLRKRMDADMLDMIIKIHNGKVPDQIRQLLHRALQDSVGWIAQSSYHDLLDKYLDVFSPEQILSCCRVRKLRRRIAFMMHLSPKVQSCLGDDLVVKNGVFFRDWVFVRLDTKFWADLKSFQYFMDNLIHNRYNRMNHLNAERILDLPRESIKPGDMRLHDLDFKTLLESVEVTDDIEVTIMGSPRRKEISSVEDLWQ